jgi:DNA replication protein DnaC
MANATDVQPQDLLRRRAELRQHQGLEARETSHTDGVASLAELVDTSPAAKSAKCESCRNDFVYLPVEIDGRPLKQTHCSSCARARQADLDAAQERARKVAEDRGPRILEILSKCGVNVREHGHCTLDNFDPSESGLKPLRSARDLVDQTVSSGRHNPVPALYLHGDTGPGKSHLAVGVLRALALNPHVDPAALIFDRADTLISRIQDTYGRRESSTLDVLEKRIGARLWVLDDLGTERASEDVARHLTLIVSERALAPTVITANLSFEELERKRPELKRLISRLGPAYCNTVAVDGRDRRFD